MDSKSLAYFVAVAEHSNMTRAAGQLNIAQSALSVAIRKLETSLGMNLFRRGERKMSLTAEGEVLLPHARQVLQKLEDARLAMQELKGLEKGEVRIGVPGMMGSYFFPQILMGFKSRYPELKLTIVEAGAQAIRNMLLEGELDLGVIVDENVPAELETDRIFRSQMVAVAGRHHPITEQTSVSFAEFFSHELVMFKSGYFHREFFDRISQERQIEPKFSFETNLLPLILRIVRQEFAVSALLELVVSEEPDVVGIPFSPPKYFDLAMAWRRDGYLSIAERTFMDFVKHHTEQAKP